MDFPTYGRNLVELLAERSLEALRGTSLDDVKQLVRGAMPEHERGGTMSLLRVGAAMSAFAAGAAVGTGVTALCTPTTGPELRNKITSSARGARKQASEIGEAVRAGVEEARSSFVRGVEEATSSVAPSQPHTRRKRAAAAGSSARRSSPRGAARGAT
jgi:hypothetical protein